ncbi:MAG: ferritin family protein [Deltaproteobacteria bacterium]|jgi:rubrerythrin
MVTPTTHEILRKALEKETQAHDFYAEVAASCAVDFVKELLLKLQNEEAKHMRMIQDMLGRLELGKALF